MAVGLKTLQRVEIKSRQGRQIAQSLSLIENIQTSQHSLVDPRRPTSLPKLSNECNQTGDIADVEQTQIFAAHQSMFGRAARQTDEGPLEVPDEYGLSLRTNTRLVEDQDERAENRGRWELFTAKRS